MYLLCEQAKRGGYSGVCTREYEARNPHTEPGLTIQPAEFTWLYYVDANNLYGHSMCKSLPVSGFTWLAPAELTLEAVSKTLVEWSDDADSGCILEVDLEYPEGLHERHDQFPLAPVGRPILEEELSEYSRGLQPGKIQSTSAKLVAGFGDRVRYPLHIGALQFYLKQGLVLKAVHRGFKFKQSKWMAVFIEFNTEMRKQAITDSLRNLFKLMNNACFGKTMENVRGRVGIRWCATLKHFLKLCAKPEFKRVLPGFGSENVRMLEMSVRRVKLNKPIYSGVTVLDWSKVHMANFYHNVLYPKFADRMELIMPDTDSFLLGIQSPDLYTELSSIRDLWLDTSKYPRDHPLHSMHNAGVLGKFKDEVVDGSMDYIAKTVALRAKCYYFETSAGRSSRKAKGVSKRTPLTGGQYQSVLRTGATISCEHRSIRGFNRTGFSIRSTKKALSAFDDKRFYVGRGVRSVAHGSVQALLLRKLEETGAPF
jgi:hypothetical protein